MVHKSENRLPNDLTVIGIRSLVTDDGALNMHGMINIPDVSLCMTAAVLKPTCLSSDKPPQFSRMYLNI